MSQALVALNTAPRENTESQKVAAAEQRMQLAIAEAAKQAEKAAQLAQKQAEAEETQRREAEAQRQRCLQQQAQAEEEAEREAQRKGDAQRAVILRTCVATGLLYLIKSN